MTKNNMILLLRLKTAQVWINTAATTAVAAAATAGATADATEGAMAAAAAAAAEALYIHMLECSLSNWTASPFPRK